MKIGIIAVSMLLTLSSIVSGAPKPPQKVAHLLAAIKTFQKNERRDHLFKRLGLWDDEKMKLVTGGSGLGVTSEVWDLTGDGHWLLAMDSNMPSNEEIAKAEGGVVLRFVIYYREKSTEKLDWKMLERQIPYSENGKVHTEQAKAEQVESRNPP